MMSRKIPRTCITLYGEVDDAKWLDWYEYSKSLMANLGFPPTHIGVSSESFKSGSILTITRAEKRLVKAAGNGESLSDLELFSLPNDFKQAAFDYDVYMARIKEAIHPNITLVMPPEFPNDIQVISIVDELKRYINFRSGQVYEMMAKESPLFYASKANPPSFYKSLKVLEEL